MMARYRAECPLHRAVYVPNGHTLKGRPVVCTNTAGIAIKVCPVCVHVAKIKVRLAVAGYLQSQAGRPGFHSPN